MESIWPYISFLLGAIFALFLQWISYRLSFRKDQRREYWIRKLNSYQDFYQHTMQLIGLLRSRVSIPDNVYWQSISLARKAAYDAAFYDTSHPERTEKMKTITLELLQMLKSNEQEPERLVELIERIEEIHREFYQEEKSLAKENTLLPTAKDEMHAASIVNEATDNVEEEDEEGVSLVVGILLAGIVYIALFLPLSWYSAIQIGLEPLDLMLFAHLPPHLNDTFFSHLLPAFSIPEARPFVYAFGTLYGVVGVVVAFMMISLRLKGWADLAVIANGILWGYYLTIYLSGHIFGIIEINLITQRIIQLKLAYIFLAYYLIEGLKGLIGQNGLHRRKYEIFFGGMYGIICTLLLMRGFGGGTTSILTGPLFLICLFITIAIAEQTIGRVFFGFIETFKQLEKRPININVTYTKNASAKQFIKEFLTFEKQFLPYFWKDFWKNMKNYKGQEFDLPFPSVKILSIIRHRHIPVLKQAFPIFVITTIFPILTFVVYRFVIVIKGYF